MSNVLRLLKGEVQRFISYKILPVSLATSLLWVIVFLFLNKGDAGYIAPLLMYVDVTMMSILLIGASNHLERQDGTIKTMMVMPVSLYVILMSKIAASILLGLQSVIVTSAGLFFVHGITFNYLLMLLFVIIAAAAHAAVGFFLALNSKDFGSMLVYLMIYLFIFTIPTVFFSVGIFDIKYDWILMISPSHSANVLISSVVSGAYEWAKIAVGCIYLALVSAALLKFAVYPKFKNNAVRG